jgi:DNA mismatch repair protein MutS2
VTIADDVRLLAARHPLLDPARAVPIDLDLGALKALVISGPNTGGKTVALKTLGLAALLHQSGLCVPADTAVLPVFDEVLADIGDRQSIEMSLSTFSGHISNLVAILASATERSLVLVDEVASGTDPVEGSALAQALVARFTGQARLTIVTTHYPELKEWASTRDDAANAATGLDPATHEPLYRIALGRPGTSHALATAERLGLDAGVVADARGNVAPERLQIADLLAEAEAAERAAGDELEAARAERADAALLARRSATRGEELEAEIAKVRASAAREREQAAAEARRELAEARGELAALRDEMRAARKAQAASPAADRALGEASTRARRAERALNTFDEPLPLLAPLEPGDPVEAPEVGVRGTIASIDGDEAEVVGAGGHRVRIALARLRPSRREDQAREPAVRILAGARSDVSDEIDVRGRRAQDAREAVRAFVDDASLAGLSSVRVVHGRGTGAVRAAVRDELKKHPLVESSASESQDGATLVQLGSSK